MKTSLIGVPIDLGSETLGIDTGPSAFRHQGIVEKLSRAGFDMVDTGDVRCQSRDKVDVGNPKLKYLQEILRVSEESSSKTARAIQKGDKVIAIGGDHSLCLGIISGASVALDGEIGLIYIDAHGDMNTSGTTLTGNIHGMPLAALMGYGDKRLTDVFKSVTKVKKENMLHVGGNDFDQGELDLIAAEKLNTFTMFDMLSDGLKPLFGKIDQMGKRVKNIWVSLDLDVIDEMYAPGVGMPNKAGFTSREITTIAQHIGKNCHVVGVDVNEYNPLTDVDGKTAELGVELIAKMLGGNYSWYSNYMEKNKLS